ncbi:bactofilin family protein [Acanthopleuribacter pedis]|uniref:Polymer-forming cytoskeletal protein n=1 Tax=Acanthopleuribacter pedis TaxID=442870 RepID=A0A8J7Q4F5_9BACT|nr:polymer-forming cytoskeletal protein [Acanthopleuribacter pedis]MBO1317877.1 polymer-forming cytoskeletal protein [Acanthopleuribacter pedis]
MTQKDNGFMCGFLSEGTRFEGSLQFSNKMRIDGDFSGDIESTDQLIIGENATVDGSISVGRLVVMGKVSGEVTQCRHLQIEEGGQVLADIRVGVLDIKPGAIFDGKCVMIADT